LARLDFDLFGNLVWGNYIQGDFINMEGGEVAWGIRYRLKDFFYL